MSEERPVPSPLGAALMTLLAFVAVLLGWVLFAPDAGNAFGLAVGLCLGFGGIGTLAARSVPGAEERLGLRGFAPRFLLPMLLFLPSLVLASELDNLVRPLFPAIRLPQDAVPDSADVVRLMTLEFAITTALLRPVLEEFFFRGVVQQGVVAALGPGRGVLLAAALFALVRTSLFAPDAYHATSLGLQALCTGLLLGFVRLASGSILPGVLLLTAIEGLGVLSYELRETLPITGFNAGGPHTPVVFLLPAALCVATGLFLLARHARQP